MAHEDRGDDDMSNEPKRKKSNDSDISNSDDDDTVSNASSNGSSLFGDGHYKMGGKEEKVWRHLIIEVCQNTDKNADTFEEYLDSPRIESVINDLRKLVQGFRKMVHILEEDSEIIRSIDETVDSLKASEYSDYEASITGWEQRKHLLRKLFMKYEDVMKQELIGDEDMEEEKEE